MIKKIIILPLLIVFCLNGSNNSGKDHRKLRDETLSDLLRIVLYNHVITASTF